MLRALCLLLVLTAIPTATAQVNTEAMRAGELEQGWSAGGSAGLELRTGNTDLVEIELGGRIDLVRGINQAFLVGSLSYQRVDGSDEVNEAFLHLRYNRIFRPWLVGESFVQTERNEQQRLARRYLIGSGARFVLTDDEPATVALGTTPMLEYERLELETDTDEDFIVRWSNYVSTRVRLAERVNLFNVVYFQPQVNDFNDWRILEEGTLAIGITETIALNVALRLRFDSKPPEGVDELDLSLRNALVIRL